MKNKMLLFLLLLLISTPEAYSQYSSSYTYTSVWKNQFSIYSWLAGQSGTIVVDGKEYKADVVFNELFRKLNGSLNIKYEGQYELLMIGWSGVFFKSYDLSDEQDIETSITLTDATVGFMPWAERFYILAGGRYYRMNVNAEIKENNQMTRRERSKGWVDLFVGARYEAPITNRVSLLLRGDVGGFGLGSDLSWNTNVIARWSISNFAPELGYRVWGVDYNSGSGDSRFEWDVVTQGMSFGMTFFF